MPFQHGFLLEDGGLSLLVTGNRRSKAGENISIVTTEFILAKCVDI